MKSREVLGGTEPPYPLIGRNNTSFKTLIQANMTTITRETKNTMSAKQTLLIKDSKALLHSLFYANKVGNNAFLPSGNLKALELEVERYVKTQSSAFVYQASLSDLGVSLEVLSNMFETVRNVCSEDEHFLRKCEGILAFVYNVSRCDSAAAFVVAITSLCHSIQGRSALALINDCVIKKFREVFSNWQYQSMFDNLDEFENMIDFSREKIDFFQSIKDAPLMQKLHKFLVFCVSFSLFDSIGLDFDFLGYSKFEAAKVAASHQSTGGFLYCLFDCVTMFAKQFVQSVRMGSYEPFFSFRC